MTFRTAPLPNACYHGWLPPATAKIQKANAKKCKQIQRQHFSPITLEYAEELLLMADTGRCAVLDVSEVPKERPTGHGDDDGDDGDDRSCSRW